MSYCSHCGKEVPEAAYICPNCGCDPSKKTQPSPVNAVGIDRDSKGLDVLAFFLPVVGLILYLCTKDSKPIRAHYIGMNTFDGFFFAIIAFVRMWMWGWL